jgi:hypothetical protein
MLCSKESEPKSMLSDAAPLQEDSLPDFAKMLLPDDGIPNTLDSSTLT